MRTSAYDTPKLYDWRGARTRARTAVRVAKVVATLAAPVPTVAFTALLATGKTANVMVTGSMEPRIGVGSLLVYETVSPEALARGDVIAFAKSEDDGAVTTHRIVEIAYRDGGPVFQTKGDDNAIADPWLLHYDAGQQPQRLAHVVPYVGHVMRAAQRPPVRICLVVLVLGWLYLSFVRVLARVGKTRRPQAAAAVPPCRAAHATSASAGGAAAENLEAAGRENRETQKPSHRGGPRLATPRSATRHSDDGVMAGIRPPL